MSEHAPVDLPAPIQSAPPVLGDPAAAGGAPFGLGARGAHGVGAVVGALWALRGDPLYAARLLSRSVGDGCSLGSQGTRHPVLPGRHLCPNRLARIRQEISGPLVLADVLDSEVLRGRSSHALRALGRLPFPLVHRAGERGFSRVTWDEALSLAGAALASAPGPRQAWLAGADRMTSECAWALSEAARAGGARPSLVAGGTWAATQDGLGDTLGEGREAGGFSELLRAELVLMFGVDPARNHPSLLRLLHHAKAEGARLVAINPVREPGLDRAWIADEPGLAVWGTRIADDFVQVRPGGDAALLNAVLLLLARWGTIDRDFVGARTEGWEALVRALEARGLETWIEASGVTAQELEWLARLVSRADRIVTIYSGGFADPMWGADAVRAAADLHLARGAVGRPGAAILPLLERLSVLGAADFGVAPTPGASERLEVADVLYLAGLDPLAELPDTERVRAALASASVRIHQGAWLDPSMLVEPGAQTVILPSCLRHEQPGGTTSTSSEHRVRRSPQIPGGPRLAEARSDWRIPLLVTGAAGDGPTMPEDAAAVRAEMASSPAYSGLCRLDGGTAWIRRGVVPEQPGSFCFVPAAPASPEAGEGLLLSARRPREGSAAELSALLINPKDAERARIRHGDRVSVESPHGRVDALAQLADIREGSTQLERPAANQVRAGPGCVEVRIARALT